MERDTTRRKRTKEALPHSEQRFQAFMDNSPVLAFLKDEAGRLVYINKSFERLFDVTLQDLRGKTDEDWLPPEVARQNQRNDACVLSTGQAMQVVETVPTPDGSPHYWLVFKFPLQDAAGIRFLGGIAVDITRQQQFEHQLQEVNAKLQAANARLEALATQDGLTGLYNQRAFQERLEEAYQHAVRYHTPLSLLLLDVDRFKRYNDRYGHLAGDEALRQVAALLQHQARAADVVARYGGEEFVIVLPHTEADGALALGERFRAALKAARWTGRTVTVSIGAATLTPAMTGRNDLIAAADRALYASKNKGRNCVTHARQLSGM
jgi:diguanylate cyclase (GGDEF)-like protein/PAS domain S-box-containing protein